MRHEGRPVAILTGGASGIGRSMAEELARRNVEVVVTDRQGELAQQVVDAIRSTGGSAYAAEVDVRAFESLQRVVATTTARTGRLDYFFNNAGIAVAGPIESYSPADWDDVFDVNLRGVAYGVSAAYPAMIAQGFGHIVNTASLAGLTPGTWAGSYTTSKFGIVGLSKALRIEAARHGVRVSVLCPGVVRTPLLKGGTYGRTNLNLVAQQQVERLWERARPMDAQLFARRALDAVARNTPVIVLPSWWKIFWYIERISPGLSARLATRALQRMQRELALETPKALPGG